MKIFGFEVDRRKVAFLLIFSVLALVLNQVKFTQILGVESKNFTLFQFIGPIGAGIVGTGLGIVAVLLAGFGSTVYALLNGGTPDLMVFVPFFTMVFGAIYFGTKGKSSAVVAAVCMALFWLNPIGQQAWFYPLYWLIPIVASFYKENIFVRSLGTTFTAHAIGSVIYLYAFPIPAATWAFLFTNIVWVERLTFAAGITLSYYAVNTLLDMLESKVKWNLEFLNIEKRYSVFRLPGPDKD